jgi:hypothetical protein
MADLIQPQAPIQPQPESARLKALRSLANQLPVANQRIAAGQKAARDLQLQQAVKAAPVAAPIASTAQQTGAALSAQAGQQKLQSAQNAVEQGSEIGKTGLQEEARLGQAGLAEQQSQLRSQEMSNLDRFANISEKAKQDLYDKQMQFQKDEAGRTLFNETQLLDYAAVNARNQEEFKNYQQQAEQMSENKLKMMELAFDKVKQDLDLKYQEAKQAGDNETQAKIIQMQNDMKQQIQNEQNERAQEKAKRGAIGGIVGGVFGGIAGGPGGAAAGASAGSSVFSAGV